MGTQNNGGASREAELHVTGDDIPDLLVGILSQTGFKVMQKLISGMRWWPHRLICEEISHCFSWTPVSNVAFFNPENGRSQIPHDERFFPGHLLISLALGHKICHSQASSWTARARNLIIVRLQDQGASIKYQSNWQLDYKRLFRKILALIHQFRSLTGNGQ